MSQTRSLSDLAHALIDAARAAGADAADALAVSGSSVSIDVRDGVLEQAERSEATDLGVRVFVGQRSAIISTSDARPETFAAMAERAVAMAREAPDDPFAGLADPAQLATDTDATPLDLADPAPEPAPADLQADAEEAEAAARDTGLISQVQSATAGYGARDIWLAASNGFSAGYRRTSRSRSCVAIAGEGLGMERDYDGDSRTYGADLRGAAEIGRSAAERAAARLGAQKPPTGTYPVLFDERISSSLIGHLMVAANGAQIARGASWLRDAKGQQVLPEGLSLVEDPTRPRISASRPFDAEGLPCTPRDVIRDGVLQGWTLDLATARKLGEAPTGNAGRGTTSGPSPSAWNLELTQGTATRDDLIAQMGTGLIVTSMIGATINPNTGDYSRGCSGLWVENGTISHPVNEGTIAGSLPDMLKRIVPANDARPWLSRVVPSILIDGMAIAGA
ncbi:TldD/PmbA family protein [Pseudaestuariivita atlantica]|uniref:Modulator protein n=1 Tax=Pseudaestuariivita atlantica TaxID=1317121 RepID=A0A0L1JPD7_9RHOB|nr:TldD/PmbA family protein [Pseudaestuariivita atlantica]KNG93591.1 modulator protein [Pseudaestuariivita atlantica]